MERLHVGTNEGLFIIDLNESSQVMRMERLIPNSKVLGIALPKNGMEAYIASGNDGLCKLDLNNCQIRRIGEQEIGSSVRCVAVSPWNDEHIWIGTEPSKVFRSKDGGATWMECKGVSELSEQRNWIFPVPTTANHIRWIEVSPNVKNRIWAAVQIGGVLRSDDGGETWQDFTDLDPDVHMIRELKSEQTVLAACGGGGWAKELLPPPAPRGFPLYRSDDLGHSWKPLLPYVRLPYGPTAMERTYAASIWVSPQDSRRILMGVAQLPPVYWSTRPTKANALLVSTQDGGESWAAVTAGLPDYFPSMPEVLAGHPVDPNIVYLATGGEGAGYVSEYNGEIYRSGDAGFSWKKLDLEFPPVRFISVLSI